MLLLLIELLVLGESVPLEISHVLIYVDHLVALLLDLTVEVFKQPAEIVVLLSDHVLVLLVVAADVRKKLLEVLRVIKNKAVDDSLVEVNRWELIRVALDNHGGHVGEVLRDHLSTLLHNEDILGLHFLEELPVSVNVREQRLELDRDVKGQLLL